MFPGNKISQIFPVSSEIVCKIICAKRNTAHIDIKLMTFEFREWFAKARCTMFAVQLRIKTPRVKIENINCRHCLTVSALSHAPHTFMDATAEVDQMVTSSTLTVRRSAILSSKTAVPHILAD